jgi:hypothetical protein
MTWSRARRICYAANAPQPVLRGAGRDRGSGGDFRSTCGIGIGGTLIQSTAGASARNLTVSGHFNAQLCPTFERQSHGETRSTGCG